MVKASDIFTKEEIRIIKFACKLFNGKVVSIRKEDPNEEEKADEIRTGDTIKKEEGEKGD